MSALLILLALSAPLPKNKPVVAAVARPSVVGAWSITWGNIPASAENGHVCGFGKDGFFSCVWQHQEWTGTYKIEGDVLTVTERLLLDPDAKPFVWAVKLKAGKLEGDLTGERLGTFRLEKVIERPATGPGEKL